MTDASRTLRVTVVGDADSLQRALGKTDASLAKTNESLRKNAQHHGKAADEGKRFEQALHSGSSTLGLYGENVEGLSRKLGGLHSLMGAGVGMGAAGLVGAAAIGGGIEVIRSSIENTEAQERALGSLRQAAGVAGVGYDGLAQKTRAYIDANRQFIPDQYEAINAMATFTRAGLDETRATQAMGIAIDLATIKGIPLTEATRGVQLALMGSGRAVRELGIDLKSLSTESDVTEQATKNVEAAQKKAEASALHLAGAQRSLKEFEDGLHGKRVLSQVDLDHLKDKHDAVTAAEEADAEAKAALKDAQDKLGVSTAKQVKILEELKQKTEGGREATTELQRSQNELKNDWQDMTTTAGPSFLQMLDLGTKGLDAFARGLQGKGEAQKGWDSLNNTLVEAAKNLHNVATGQDALGKEAGKGAGRYAGAWQEANAQVVHSERVAEIASHGLSERLDQQADAASRAGAGLHGLSEDGKETSQTIAHFRDESERTSTSAQTMRDHVAYLSGELQANADSNRLAASMADWHRKALYEEERQVQVTAQGIRDIKEAVDHANQDRLEIKVDSSALDAAARQLAALQQAAEAGMTVNISTGGTMGPGEGLVPFAEGTDYVPRNMPAFLHRGEMVVPAAEAAAIRRGATMGGGNGGHTFNINVTAGLGSDGDAIGQAVARQVRRELALRGL